eukprot:2238845-Pyramimonas_sp.AAC.2
MPSKNSSISSGVAASMAPGSSIVEPTSNAWSPRPISSCSRMPARMALTSGIGYRSAALLLPPT